MTENSGGDRRYHRCHRMEKMHKMYFNNSLIMYFINHFYSSRMAPVDTLCHCWPITDCEHF